MYSVLEFDAYSQMGAHIFNQSYFSADYEAVQKMTKKPIHKNGFASIVSSNCGFVGRPENLWPVSKFNEQTNRE